MKKITTFMAMCLISVLSLSSFVPAKATENLLRCAATYTVVIVDGNGNVLDKATMHGYGETCAEAMAEAKWRMEPVKEWLLIKNAD